MKSNRTCKKRLITGLSLRRRRYYCANPVASGADKCCDSAICNRSEGGRVSIYLTVDWGRNRKVTHPLKLGERRSLRIDRKVQCSVTNWHKYRLPFNRPSAFHNWWADSEWVAASHPAASPPEGRFELQTRRRRWLHQLLIPLAEVANIFALESEMTFLYELPRFNYSLRAQPGRSRTLLLVGRRWWFCFFF